MRRAHLRNHYRVVLVPRPSHCVLILPLVWSLAPPVRADDGGMMDGATKDAASVDAGGGGVTHPLCPLDHVGCVTDTLDFTHRDTAFEETELDTGWVPADAAIQLRFRFVLAGGTDVDMGATALGYWPPALGVRMGGRPGTGRLAMSYGLELVVELRFDVTIGGVGYRWSGELPVPGIPEDLRLSDETGFDPMLLPPSERPVTASDATDEVLVLRNDTLGEEIPVVGVGGGIALAVQMELDTAYRTDRIVLEGGSPIETEDGVSTLGPDMGPFELGPAKDFDTHPEGSLDYDGTVWFRPVLYLSFAGVRRDYPLTEIPVPVEIARAAVFDAETAHLPLPDIEVDPTDVTFGEVRVGGATSRTVNVHNRGEHALELAVDDAPGPFEVSPATMELPPSHGGRLSVRYTPEVSGSDEASVRLLTNDPDAPEVTLHLRGAGLEPAGSEDAGTDLPADGGRIEPPAGSEGGCGCRTVPRHEGLRGVAVAALVMLLLVRRRRVRPRRAP